MKNKLPFFVFIISLLMFLGFLERPARLVYDEKFYVPAAVEILHGKPDPNFQHPPIAKELIAIGIGTAGNNPLGWRIASSVMGAATMTSLYYLAVLLLGSSAAAISTLVFVSVSGLFYTLSRLAFLDVFAFGFSVMAITVVFAWLQTPERFKKASAVFAAAGLLLGLALAAKWSAIVFLAIAMGVLAHSRRLRAKDWMIFSGCTLLYYFLPFLLLTEFQFSDFISVMKLQSVMWDFHHPAVVAADLSLENTSAWWQWPFRNQPMWLAVFPPEVPNANRFVGVSLFGNPVVLWLGFLALGFCLVKRTSQSWWIMALALAPWLFWAVQERAVTYYTYYLPTSVFLSFALVHVVKNRVLINLLLAAATLWFVYHWPLMSGLEMSLADFQKFYPHVRMWGENP